MRERMSKEERHKQILRVAQELFKEHGYEHVTIADVIAASNIARGTFYLHFASLEQLLGDLFEQVVDEAWRRISPLIQNDSMPFQACADTVIRAALHLFTDDEGMGTAFVAGGGRLFREKRQAALHDRLGGLIVQSAEKLNKGPIPHLEWTVAILTSMVTDMSYHAATHASLKDDPVAKQQFLNHVIDFALAGLERQVAPYLEPRPTTTNR